MRFWDASAIVPLLVDEPVTTAVRALFDRDPHMVVWWATEVECVSAVTRREREGALDLGACRAALDRLGALARHWDEVQPTGGVRDLARRLLRVHPLRTADALQLSAALTLADGRPGSLAFVCLDPRLSDAALREGLLVVEGAGDVPG